MIDPARFSRRAFMVMPLALAACTASNPEVFRIGGATMGTVYQVVAIDAARRLSEDEVKTAVEGALAEVNSAMSNWDPASEISRFNGQTGTGPVAVSPALNQVMAAAEAIHTASNGRFDTTMGPIIELWGFGAPGATAMPSDTALAAARARAGHANTLQVGQGTLQKTQPAAQVYLAGIGKGYGADHVGRALERLGIENYLVEIGGDMYAAGRNPDGLPWQIGIETPAADRMEVLRVVGVSNLGLASSGDYRNYVERDGVRFSHLIDPSTGRPVTHDTASTTVLADNAMLADGWATAFHIMGKDEGLAVAEAEGLAVLFTERDRDADGLRFKTTASRAFRAIAG
ncbi:MAG: FAD:protein FMN transferase [Pseudomonadota bacterium]